MTDLENKKIKELRKKMEGRAEHEKSFYEERGKIFFELQQLLKKSIFNEKLLCEGKWFLDYQNLWLYACGNDFPQLVKIMQEISGETWGYHFGITIKSYGPQKKLFGIDREVIVELRYDDGELALSFINCQNKIYDFITEHALKIDMTKLDKEISVMQEKLKTFNKIKESIMCERIRGEKK